MKRTKKEKHILDIWQRMETYEDFIEFLSGTTKSIGIRCNNVKELSGVAGKNVMLNDLVREYDRVKTIHYTKAFAGSFKSNKSKDAGKYIARFKKEVFMAVNRKYATGYAYANMEQYDLLHTLELFFALF